MTHPYVTPDRPAPKWARKRYVLPALGLVFFLGLAAGGTDSQPDDAGPAAAEARPTATVTATATATTTAEPEPAPTVTETVKVKVTRTVTAEPAPASGADDSSGGGSVYYENCAAARAAGAAPVHRGDPGYGGHLDRDGDGTGCDWG